MGSKAHDASTYGSVYLDGAPTFPYQDDLHTGVTALRSAEHSEAGAEDLTLYQVMNFAPNPNVTHQAPTALQNSRKQHPPIPQQISLSLENAHLVNEHSDIYREYVAKHTSRPSESNKEDWEQHKSKITDLYQKNNLNEVMDIMKREHGIKASKKMYKDRIHKWKIDKKVKGEEMKAIIRKQTQRSQAGKKSAFRIRNSQVSELKIVRYRKAIRLSSEEQALRLRAPTPPELICYTPLASPLTTPRVLETPERIVRLIQEYIDGSLDSKTWLVTENQMCVSSKNIISPVLAFEEKCIHARRMFRLGETKNVWQVLNMAMAHIEQIVSAETPNTLDVLAKIVSAWCSLSKVPGIAFTFLKQFSAVSAAILSKGHPFNQIFALLIGLDTSHLEHTLGIAQQTQADCFARRSGRFGWDALQLQLSILSLEPAVQTTEAYLSLLRECESALGTSDIRSQGVRLRLAWNYINQGEFKEAAKVAQNTITLAAQSQYGVECYDSLYALSTAQFKLSETDLAEQNIRQAIHFRVVDFGWEDDYVLSLISELERWLKQWNRPDEAAEVRRQIDGILAWKREILDREEEKRYRRCRDSEV